MPAKITTAEHQLIEWQCGRLSGFYRDLWNLIAKADSENLKLLSRGFPQQVRVYRKYANKDHYWVTLMRRWGQSQ